MASSPVDSFSAMSARAVAPTPASACGPMQAAVRVEDILDAFHHLARPWKTWSKDEISRAIHVLKNRNCFIVGGCSKESVAVWLAFVTEWEAFLDSDPVAQAQVDPPYICFTFPAGGPPVGFSADVATADVRAGIVGAGCADGSASTSVFTASSPEWAHAFAGRMRALYPAVFCHTMKANVAMSW
jgi:hypothetical protein